MSFCFVGLLRIHAPVSYTHLDVYKRQDVRKGKGISMAELSRRSFVKAAAMGAVGIAAAGYATGCSPAADASSGSSAPGASIQFDEEYDVVVVGAGLGGAAAALTVASEGDGATCLLVEKGSSPGGNSPFCDNSAMFTDNPDAIYSYLRCV